MDSFFDMPAGYNDADLEMAELEAAGNRYAKMVRCYGEAGVRALEAGETIEHPCTNKATAEKYTVRIRLEGPSIVSYDRLYSMDGARWFYTAREAYEAARIAA